VAKANLAGRWRRKFVAKAEDGDATACIDRCGAKIDVFEDFANAYGEVR
jgi:hypothetical protein